MLYNEGLIFRDNLIVWMLYRCLTFYLKRYNCHFIRQEDMECWAIIVFNVCPCVSDDFHLYIARSLHSWITGRSGNKQVHCIWLLLVSRECTRLKANAKGNHEFARKKKHARNQRERTKCSFSLELV